MDLSWTGVPPQNGHFRLRFRTGRSAAWTDLGQTLQTSFSHGGRDRATVHEYKLTSETQYGEPSAAVHDYAVTLSFSNDPLLAGGTMIRGIHIGELRETTDAWRRFADGLPNAFPSYEAATGIVPASHLADILNALNAARLVIGLGAFAYTGVDPPTPGGLIRRAHVEQLRGATR